MTGRKLFAEHNAQKENSSPNFKIEKSLTCPFAFRKQKQNQASIQRQWVENLEGKLVALFLMDEKVYAILSLGQLSLKRNILFQF